jgi:hypothetical protein
MPAGTGRDELRSRTGRAGSWPRCGRPGGSEWAHLEGPVNIPLKELDARTGQLDRSRPVIVYCHDWY